MPRGSGLRLFLYVSYKKSTTRLDYWPESCLMMACSQQTPGPMPSTLQ